jgi:uncharacterized protein (DUF697 family)
MMASIAHTYGIEVDRATTAALAATGAATAAGRSTVAWLIELFPGVGTAVGGTIAAGVASGVTLAIGQSWVVVCGKLSRGELPMLAGALDSGAVRAIFMEEFRGRMKKALPADA